MNFKFNQNQKWQRILVVCLVILLSFSFNTNTYSQLTGSVNIANATCNDSFDGSITLLVEGGVAPYTFEWSNGVSSTSGEALDGFTFMGYFEDHAYYRSTAGQANLASAQAQAVSNRGYLVSINSQAENDWIFANGGQTGDFLGGTDFNEEGTFRWASGEPFDYINWGAGEPNNSGDEDFIVFQGNGQWNDADWSSGINSRYIIEVPIWNQIENLTAGDYTITVADDNGLTEQRTFTVGPDAIEISFDIVPTSSCDGAVNDGMAEAFVSGGTAPYTYGWSSGETVSDISDLSAGQYTLSVTDDNGCVSEAVVQIEVQDETEPTVLVQSATIYLDEDGLATVSVEDINNGSFDDCGIAEIFVRNPDFDCNGSLTGSGLTAELVVIDEAGNEVSGAADIAVIDTIKPEFNLESIELQISEEGMGILTQEMVAPFASDNCQVNEVAIEVTEFACDLAPSALTTEVIVFDINGNFVQKTLSIVLTDDVQPTVTVEDITLELDENGVAILDEEALDMTIIDNCVASDISFSTSEFDCSHLGTNAEGVLVTDFSGNEGSTEFTVTVVDNIAPEISGPQIISICEGEQVDLSQISASDNCSASLLQLGGPADGSIPSSGQYAIQFEATDLSNNTTNFSAILNVQPGPEVDLGEDMEVDEGTEITLIAGENNANTYLWSDGSIGSIYQFVATEDVTVTVEVTTPEGCSVTDEINITIGSFLGVDEDTNRNGVRFFPNPTQGQLSIALSLQEVATDVRINVTDISGKSVVQRLLPTAQNGDVISLDLSSFAEGIYLINLQSDSFNLTERVVKH